MSNRLFSACLVPISAESVARDDHEVGKPVGTRSEYQPGST